VAGEHVVSPSCPRPFFGSSPIRRLKKGHYLLLAFLLRLTRRCLSLSRGERPRFGGGGGAAAAAAAAGEGEALDDLFEVVTTAHFTGRCVLGDFATPSWESVTRRLHAVVGWSRKALESGCDYFLLPGRFGGSELARCFCRDEKV
jgi:hypothetical protein